MVQYLLEVSLCWLVAFGLYQLLLSQETFFRLNRWYLLISLGLGLWLPTLSFTTFQTTASEYTFYYTLNEVVVGVDTQIQESSTSWWWYVYGMGVVFFLGRFIKDLVAIIQLAKRAEIEKHPTHYHVATATTHPPFSFFKWLFMSQQPKLDATDEAHIINHEIAHIQQWHSLDILAIELLTIIFWFNPLLHWYKSALREVHEYEADQVVTQSISTREYGYLLVRQTVSNHDLSITHNFNQSQLKKRILMMTKKESPQHALLKYLLSVPILGLVMFVFSSFDTLPTTELFNLSNHIKTETKNQPLTLSIDEPITKPAPLKKSVSALTTLDSIYTLVDEMPRFPGCEDEKDKSSRTLCSNGKLLKWVYQTIKYPEAARKKGVEGVVIVQFVVNKSGQVLNPKILRSLDESCDKEVIRVINAMKAFKWIPGVDKGKKVNVNFKFPIRFKLADDDKKAKAEDVTLPYFAGCEDIKDAKERRDCSNKELFKFIMGNLKYPKAAKEAGKEGFVVVSFKVNDKGQVIEPFEFAKKDDKVFQDAALSVMQKMKAVKWSPGMKDGKPVTVEMKLPFKFKLPKDEKKK